MPEQDKRSKSADSAFDIGNVHSSVASNDPTALVASCIIGPITLKAGKAAKSRSCDRDNDDGNLNLNLGTQRVGSNVDLVGMPTAGHHGVLDALRGSMTERVPRHAPCPVLAVSA